MPCSKGYCHLALEDKYDDIKKLIDHGDVGDFSIPPRLRGAPTF